MAPALLSSANSEKLEIAKKEVRSILIAYSQERVTLDQLPDLFESELGECIRFEDYNFCTLKEFLLSIPDTVRLIFDKETNKTYVEPVESNRTKHISSLIARQKKADRQRKRTKPRLNSNYIDPVLLMRLMLKLSSCSINRGYFKKDDLLSEIQAIIGVQHSFYTMRDLNSQLNELSHILTHNDGSIYLKNEARNEENLVKQRTKERLQKLLTEKYPEGICTIQLPDVYRKEYRVDLEYRDLGFYDIGEFVAVLPRDVFKCINPANSSMYKLLCVEMLANHSKNLAVTNSLENVAADNNAETSHTPPTHSGCSKAVSTRLIPKEFMNFEDSVEQINVDTILDKSHIIVSEISNPSLFWIILFKNRRKLIKLMDSLQKFYEYVDNLDKYKIPPIVMKPGLHVACLYSNRWHRGIIKTVCLNSLMILFYDYGTTKAYKAKKLYFLHKKFVDIPAQAIPCCLFNVKPTAAASYKWNKMAIEKFVDRTIEREFIVSIHNRNQENNSITVDLIDTTNKTANLSISQWMVLNDLATRGSQIAEHDNFMARHRKESSSKRQKKLITKTSPNVNKITSCEEEQYTDYVRPAQKLEALRKYKTRFNSLEISSTGSSRSTTEKEDESTSNQLSIKENKEDNAQINCSNNNHVNDRNSIDHIRNNKSQKITNKNITSALKELEKLMMSTKL